MRSASGTSRGDTVSVTRSQTEYRTVGMSSTLARPKSGGGPESSSSFVVWLSPYCTPFILLYNFNRDRVR
jgi:hypothetical protein